MKSISLAVSQVERITPEAVKISFIIPQDKKIAFDFFAGQYITLQQTLNNESVRRAYSICSSPYEEELSVAIKQLPQGKFSTYACQELQAGDILEVFPPEGKFAYIPEISPEDLALFAAGSGITPMLSIIRVALQKNTLKILLLYGNKSPQTAMFLSEIEALREQYPDRLFVQYVYSKSHEKGALFGRIDPAMVHHLLKSQYASIDFGRFYICGPEQMVASVKQELLLSYDKKKIHTELFATENTPKKEYKGTTDITVRLNGQERVFTIERKKDILSELLKQGLEVSYSCLSGVCSSCIGKVTQGGADMDKNQVLSEEEVAKGLILTCQSHPTSQELTLEFDY